MSEGIIVALIGVVTGLGGSALGYFFLRPKTSAEAKRLTAEAGRIEADTNQVIQDTIKRCLIDPLEKRVAELEKRVRKLENRAARYLARIAYLMDGIRRLIMQLEEAKLDPLWQPDEWEPDREE